MGSPGAFAVDVVAVHVNEVFSVGQAVGVGGRFAGAGGLASFASRKRPQVELSEHVFDPGDAQGKLQGGDGLLVGFADDTEGEGFGGGGSSLDEDDTFSFFGLFEVVFPKCGPSIGNQGQFICAPFPSEGHRSDSLIGSAVGFGTVGSACCVFVKIKGSVGLA